MAGFVEQFGPGSSRLGRAGYQMLGPILSMWASIGATDDSELRPRVQALLERLSAADLNAYTELAALL